MWTQGRIAYTIALVALLYGCATGPKCEWRIGQPAYTDVMSHEWHERVPYFLKLSFEDQHKVFMYSTFCMHPNTHFFDDAFTESVRQYPGFFAAVLAMPSNEEQKVKVLHVLLHSDKRLFLRISPVDRESLVAAIAKWVSKEKADMAKWLIAGYPGNQGESGGNQGTLP